jgi:hypothetical protein
MKVQELPTPEMSAMVSYRVEESRPIEILAATENEVDTPKLRPMRTICLYDCAIPE